MRLFDRLFDKPKPKEWKCIGTMDVGLRERAVGADKPKDIPCIAGFYMTEDGDRRVVLKPEDYTSGINKFYPEVSMWEAGGPFPEAFVPIDDVLGDMLNRMIDAKLTGKKP